ncbi:MAG: DUF6361 family protein [Actinomycetota bacterium]|nr:DUF6361 family protein [Actinomycetota bacterium]
MRELVALFAQEESRDELGIGAVRDAFSDRLFPGTSVVQTRARYLLFVPWIFREAERRRLSGSALRAWAETRERWLIPALKRGGDESGLIGRLAGAGVKTLPSTIYWTGLQTYGVARHPGTFDQAVRSRNLLSTEEADELADRSPSLWHPTLPQHPDRFFSFESATFELTYDEASWLAERLADQVADTMLGYLVLHRLRPSSGTTAPWEEPSIGRLPDHLRAVVEHARLFSQAIHGAVLVYNLLLGRRAVVLGFDNAAAHVANYEELLSNWWSDTAADPAMANWSRDEFWDVVRASGANVTLPTTTWVNAWLDRVADGSAGRAAKDSGVSTLVADRERRLKGPKSRLVNDRLLANWSGAAGTARLVYRWGTVRTQLTDLFNGLDDAGA